MVTALCIHYKMLLCFILTLLVSIDVFSPKSIILLGVENGDYINHSILLAQCLYTGEYFLTNLFGYSEIVSIKVE